MCPVDWTRTGPTLRSPSTVLRGFRERSPAQRATGLCSLPSTPRRVAGDARRGSLAGKGHPGTLVTALRCPARLEAYKARSSKRFPAVETRGLRDSPPRALRDLRRRALPVTRERELQAAAPASTVRAAGFPLPLLLLQAHALPAPQTRCQQVLEGPARAPPEPQHKTPTPGPPRP